MGDPLTVRLVVALVAVSLGIALVHRGGPSTRLSPMRQSKGDTPA
jgi:hypothetical protein